LTEWNPWSPPGEALSETFISDGVPGFPMEIKILPLFVLPGFQENFHIEYARNLHVSRSVEQVPEQKAKNPKYKVSELTFL
jgi:hypothetical protein